METTYNTTELLWEIDLPNSTATVFIAPDDLDPMTFNYSETTVASIHNLLPGTAYQMVIVPEWNSLLGDFVINDVFTLLSEPKFLSIALNGSVVMGEIAIVGRFEVLTVGYNGSEVVELEFTEPNLVVPWSLQGLLPGQKINITATAHAGEQTTEATVEQAIMPSYVNLVNQTIHDNLVTTMRFEALGFGFGIELQVYDFDDVLVYESLEQFSEKFDKDFEPDLLGYNLHVRVVSYLMGNFSYYSIGIARVKDIEVLQVATGAFEFRYNLSEGDADEIAFTFDPDDSAQLFPRSFPVSENPVTILTVDYGSTVNVIVTVSYRQVVGAPSSFSFITSLNVTNFTQPTLSATATVSSLSLSVLFYGHLSFFELSFDPQNFPAQIFGECLIETNSLKN